MGTFTMVLIIFTLLVFLATVLEYIIKTKFPKPIRKRALLQLMVLIPTLIIAVWLLPADYGEHALAILSGLGIGIFSAELVKRKLGARKK